jgi:hypothetical protein
MTSAHVSSARRDPRRPPAAGDGHGLVSIFWLLLYEQFEVNAMVYGAFTSQNRTLQARWSR